jgi:hypothetical protein
MKILASWQGLLHGRPELLPSSGANPDEVPGLALAPMTSLIWCISGLTALYFTIVVLLAVSRLFWRWRSDRGADGAMSPPIFQQALESAEVTVNVAPMMCLLFLAAQMQAMHNSNNRDDPAAWIRICMVLAVVALLLQTLLAIAVPLATGVVPEPDKEAALVAHGGPELVQVVSLFFSYGALRRCRRCLCGYRHNARERCLGQP